MKQLALQRRTQKGLILFLFNAVANLNLERTLVGTNSLLRATNGYAQLFSSRHATQDTCRRARRSYLAHERPPCPFTRDGAKNLTPRSHLIDVCNFKSLFKSTLFFVFRLYYHTFAFMNALLAAAETGSAQKEWFNDSTCFVFSCQS